MQHRIKNIHFVGIGGSGMSGIAELMHNLGYVVSGSDMSESAMTRYLSAKGITVYIGHQANQIEQAHVLVTSSAVKADNPEVIAARQRKLPIVPRAVMLAELMRLKSGIAVAGTHGKTTTTSLVASVLAAGELDPTFVIGGLLNSAGANAKLGQGKYIVVEADESDASFLNLSPMMSIITNIDQDHMETYGHDFGKLKTSFVEFLHRMPFYGVAVLCVDDINVREIIPFVSRPIITYGLSPDAQVRAEHIQAEGTAMTFTVHRSFNGKTYAPLSIHLNLPGEHNVKNALAAISIATELGVSDQAIVGALSQFKGVGRRFEQHTFEHPTNHHAFICVDDYGHHPVEMQATIAAVRGAFPDKRLVLAFQPHRYTRTRDCFEDFVKVLGSVDALLLCEVYAAGEAPIVAADGRALARAVRVQGKLEPIYVEHMDELPVLVLDTVQPGDVLLSMGAGSIGQLPQALRALIGESK